jgi:energy-coupling factor transporter ATP-binding protein EcfA2
MELDGMRALAEIISPASLPAATGSPFEHSITWEDDLWRADPCDVDCVHESARRQFLELLLAINAGQHRQARMLLFQGQSGAGKTHLIRALRTYTHHYGMGYLGYAQMSSDVSNYADFFLRRLVNSLEKSYDPFERGPSALRRLSDHMTDTIELTRPQDLDELREMPLDDAALAALVLRIADEIVASPQFVDQELDINIVRALLYMQRNDPRIDGRVRQYLYGRPLNELSQAAVAALDPNFGEDRAFEIIESIGRVMWTVDRAALVFCIDQVEDLRSLGDPEERFERAIRDLIQISNRVPTSITIVSSLEDFYRSVRERLPRSFVDRVEKAGPILLADARTAEEARLIIEKRLAHASDLAQLPPHSDLAAMFGPSFFAEMRGLSPRRLLEAVQLRLSGKSVDLDAGRGGIAVSGGSGGSAGRQAINDRWERFNLEFAEDVPSDEAELLSILVAALQTAGDECSADLSVSLQPGSWGNDVHGVDVVVRHETGATFENRVFICNKGSQGGALKRQLDRIGQLSKGRSPIVMRASDFPPSAKSGTGASLRQFIQAGGRRIVVSLNEWERMIALNEFRARYRQEPGFTDWLMSVKPLSHLPSVTELLRFDLLPGADVGHVSMHAGPAGELEEGAARPFTVVTSDESMLEPPMPEAGEEEPPGIDVGPVPELADAPEDIMLGRALSAGHSTVTLDKSILKRHAAVLGGSGSGKTTLALSMIEQLLLKGIPVVLIDRKGDLCSYANPEVWRGSPGDDVERRDLREQLASNIDVAVYTPGRTSGRPISITLLPTGIAELPEHEQQLLANVSAAALGDMLHLRNSATHQRQGGILAVALKILGATSLSEVTLPDLIYLLENEDPALTELTQRMDPSGKIRRDLVAQLDSLRHRNWALFEGGGEPLRMDSLLGIGSFARQERTRLSIIYTGFLGDNENILFWVSQFLTEALRFCQRNPNDELQAVIMFDEADLYIPANSKPATKEPLESLLKRARSAGIGIMLATQSPGDLDYKSRDQITSWFIGKVREDTALRKLRAAFSAMSGIDPAQVLPHQAVGEFHLIQEGLVLPLKTKRSLIQADQVPFDRIEQLAHETKGAEQRQLKLEL